jgi:hypothetical protein
VANVGHRVLQAAPGGKHLVDARSSNARVRNLEEALLERISSHGDGVIQYTDDHSKWSPDKRRGLTSKATIMHLGERKRAPYSDMGDKIPGVKAVTSSHLYVHAPEPCQAGTGAVRQKRGISVQKTPVAIQRILFERPHTASSR